MGGAIGGLVGGALGLGGGGGLLGGLLGPAGGIFNSLAEKFGMGDVVQGITNFVTDKIGQGIKSLVDSSPMFGFMKDGVNSMIDSAVSSEQREIPCDCQDAVNNDLGSFLEDFVQNLMDFVKESMQEDQREDSEGGTEGSSGGGKAASSGNWMIALAKAMGEVNGKHLSTMVEKAQELSSIADAGEGLDPEKTEDAAKIRENAADTAVVTAEMQGASKMFSMAQEASSTVLKSIGDGLSSMARKQ